MLELLANGLVADPRITSPSARFDSRRDASLPGAPWVSATVGFSWRLSLGERLDLLIDGGPFYVGASRLTFGGRQHSNGRLRHGKARLRCRNGGMDSDRLRGHSLRHRSQHLGLQRPFPPFRHPVHHVFTASHDRPEVKVGAVVGFAGSRGLRLGVDRQTSESPTAFGGGAFWCFGCGSTHWPQQYIRRDRYSGLMGSRHAPSFSTVTNAPVPDISAEAQIRRSY
jgi:hypothetical protein